MSNRGQGLCPWMCAMRKLFPLLLNVALVFPRFRILSR